MIMAAPKSKKEEKRILKKQLRSQHTLFKHEHIKTSQQTTQHLVVANGGLGNNVSREDLEKLFSSYGKILQINMKPGKPYSFISYSLKEEAAEAMTALHGKEINDVAKMCNPPNLRLYLSYVESVPGCEAASSQMPPGLQCHEDFISPEYEKQLLDCIDWEQHDKNIKEGNTGVLKHRKVKHYGYEFLYGVNSIDTDCPLEHGIPLECDHLIDRLMERNIIMQRPDQLTVNQYQPGQGIPPHIDTHSACEDGIISVSLGSQVIMDFRHPNGQHYPVLLPQRSVVVMTGPARYQFTHGITPRKSDVVPLYGGAVGDGNTPLTMSLRETRTSFTFRKVRRSPCRCGYGNLIMRCCDCSERQTPRVQDDEIDCAAKLEQLHVHKVYDEIAGHFSDTRHTPWPRVSAFLHSLAPGSLVADIGCGNGKYMNVNKTIAMLGTDRSLGLCAIARDRGCDVMASDVLSIPFLSSHFDAVICIAVIHHLSTEARRLAAIQEIIRVIQPGGRALIYVWALEQKRNQIKSSYISGKRSEDTGGSEGGTPDDHNLDPSVHINHLSVSKSQSTEPVSGPSDAVPTELPIHVNRTEFKSRDLLVPWHLHKKGSSQAEKESAASVKRSENETSRDKVHHRYYHVFEEGELELLCNKLDNAVIIELYYDQGNWCVILEKTSCDS